MKELVVPSVVSRIESLQNNSRSLRWGRSYTTARKDDLWVLCCGHKEYKTILTLTVEKKGRQFLVKSDEEGDYSELVTGSADECVYSVIGLLKRVYPEVRR